jgi:hypothetical protein
LDTLTALDEQFRVASTSYRSATHRLAEDKFSTGTERTLTEQLASSAISDVKYLSPQLRAARAALPPGVTTQAGLDDYLAKANAGISSRATGRANLLGNIADQQAGLETSRVTDYHTAGPLAQAAAITGRQDIAAGVAQNQQDAVRQFRQLAEATNGAKDQLKAALDEVIRNMTEIRTNAAKQTQQARAAANSQP